LSGSFLQTKELSMSRIGQFCLDLLREFFRALGSTLHQALLSGARRTGRLTARALLGLAMLLSAIVILTFFREAATPIIFICVMVWAAWHMLRTPFRRPKKRKER
jgi:hypothetical protein